MGPMNTQKNSFIQAAFLLLALLSATGCHKPEPPEYYGFQDIRVTGTSGNTTTLATTLKLYNPNPFHLTLKKAEMDISVNGQLSGHSVLDSTILIPQRDTFYVPVSLQLNLQSVLNNALAMLLSKKVKITLDGRAHLKKGGFPLSVPFHYETEEDLNSLLPSGF
jgi:LEA14-like dessication related protein